MAIPTPAKVQASEVTFELQSLGWKAFQQLCASIVGEVWGQLIQTFYESNDGGRDGAFRKQALRLRKIESPSWVDTRPSCTLVRVVHKFRKPSLAGRARVTSMRLTCGRRQFSNVDYVRTEL
jgi:hypothetical protein